MSYDCIIFFFQAEDGIRDKLVTGVQTCALPISQVCGDLDRSAAREWLVPDGLGGYAMGTVAGLRTRRYHGLLVVAERSEERRVGKESRSWWAWGQSKRSWVFGILLTLWRLERLR